MTPEPPLDEPEERVPTEDIPDDHEPVIDDREWDYVETANEKRMK